MPPPDPAYPVRLQVDPPEHLSRGLPFVKWLLAVPHYFALAVLAIGVVVALFIAFFGVLLTGMYPTGPFNYLVGFERWRLRVTAYVWLQTDQYPPFTLSDVPSYPVHLQVDYPLRIARWRPLVHWLLVIPAWFGTAVVGMIASIFVFYAFFGIVFTGRYQEELFDTVTIAERWATRMTVFGFWMTEAYPPFVWA
jgi:hypothetical protein